MCQQEMIMLYIVFVALMDPNNTSSALVRRSLCELAMTVSNADFSVKRDNSFDRETLLNFCAHQVLHSQ